MEIEVIREAVDRLYEQNKPGEAEEVLQGAISVAAEEQDGYAVLQLLNELIGHYRETSEFEKGAEVCEQAVYVAGNVLPKESVPYATTLLNVATFLRTAGKPEDALTFYGEVERIYANALPANSDLYGSLWNNESLVYQELGEFDRAKEYLVRSLGLAQELGNRYRVAVSSANLAGTCMQLGELEEGRDYAEQSVRLFGEEGVADQHYCAALSALGSYYYIKGEFEAGARIFEQAMEVMEQVLGRNSYYARLEENRNACLAGLTQNDSSADMLTASVPENRTTSMSGLEISRRYYEKYGAPMLADLFGDYLDRIAVGLVGEGSDCYGFDDELSRDHDWGPSFCMWVTRETYDAIGPALQEAYEALPDTFLDVKRAPYVSGKSRRGVQIIDDFYHRLIGSSSYEAINWQEVNEYGLSAAVNGEVWADPEGIFTGIRDRLMKGYPLSNRLVRVAEHAARFCREGQYNTSRFDKRGDKITVSILISDAIREAMKLAYLTENRYAPHDKWLWKGLDKLQCGPILKQLIEDVYRRAEDKITDDIFDNIGSLLANQLYQAHIISDIDFYLDHHVAELMYKAGLAHLSVPELAVKIAETEFAAFDKVQNEGGRASCQDDWTTFSIMRRSQYMTWSKEMCLQYLYDFETELAIGHNLITEKYGRMMESTAPERFEEIKSVFPEVSDEKKNIINVVAQIQVAWMEEFAEQYPHLASQARQIHAYEDLPYNTSYETYLRGELATYSDKMLELYAGFIVGISRDGGNLAYDIMKNNCSLYGYESPEAAERIMAK